MSELKFHESSFSKCSFKFGSTFEQKFKDCSFYNCSFEMSNSSCVPPLQHQQKQEQDMQAADDSTTLVNKTSNARVPLQQQPLQKQDMQAADGTAFPVVKTPGLLSSLLSAFFFQWKLFILFLILQQMVFWTIADHVRFQEPFGPEPAPEGWEAMMRLQERSRSSTVQLGIPRDVQGIVYVGIASNVLLRAIERIIVY